MRCHVLLVNRNHAKYYRRAQYDQITGKFKKGFFTWVNFAIGQNVKPIDLDRADLRHKERMTPLFIVNELTMRAVGVGLKEEADIDLNTKLNLIAKASFWKNLSEKIKINKWEMLTFFFAGYGLFRFIEYILTGVLRVPSFM